MTHFKITRSGYLQGRWGAQHPTLRHNPRRVISDGSGFPRAGDRTGSPLPLLLYSRKHSQPSGPVELMVVVRQ